VSKKHLQQFYGRKTRSAKQNADDQMLKAITNNCEMAGGQELSVGKLLLNIL
jgi:hypothetical protein